MSPRTRSLLPIVALLIAALAAYLVINQRPAPDREQILTQISALADAVSARDVGGMMQEISANYTDSNGYNIETVHLLLSRYLHEVGPIHVEMTPPSVEITGDKAVTSCDITIRSVPDGAVRQQRPITLDWQREDGHRLLIIPTKLWRVVSAKYGDITDY